MAMTDAEAHFYIAFDLLQKGKFEAAAGEALLAIKASATPYLDAERLLAASYSSGAGDREDVISQYEKITTLDPNDAGSWLRLALYARELRDDYFNAGRNTALKPGGSKLSAIQLQREADKYFKLSNKAFKEAKTRYPAFLTDASSPFALFMAVGPPLEAGDYILDSESMPVKESIFWYDIAASFDPDSLTSAISEFFGVEDPEQREEIRNGILESIMDAQRKKALVESGSGKAKAKRNNFAESTTGRRFIVGFGRGLLAYFIAGIVLLFLCWIIFTLIT